MGSEYNPEPPPQPSTKDSLEIVKNLYAAGAAKAHVIKIERIAGHGETTNTVCVELPATRNERQ